MGKTSIGAEFYEKPGKRQFTRLILALAAKEDCRSFGGFWGRGGEAIEAAAAGLDVLAVDNDESVADEMRTVGAAHGIAVHIGNVTRVKQHRDIWHADFMDTPKPENFKTLRHISTIADEWIAVTLATDHIKNPEMQGESLMATLPAWLTFACEGFTLEYFAWYRRHETKGLRMWVALLKRKAGKGTAHVVLPVQIAYSLRLRGYWASRLMYESGMAMHRGSPTTAHDKNVARDKRQVALREFRVECHSCGRVFKLNRILSPGRIPMYCGDECRRNGRQSYRAQLYWNNRDVALAKMKDYRQQKLRDRTLACVGCGTAFTHPAQAKGRVPRYCSRECALAAKAMQQRQRREAARLAAVSGTAAEAVNSD